MNAVTESDSADFQVVPESPIGFSDRCAFRITAQSIGDAPMKRFVFSIICSLSVLAASAAQVLGQELALTVQVPGKDLAVGPASITMDEGSTATINVTRLTSAVDATIIGYYRVSLAPRAGNRSLSTGSLIFPPTASGSLTKSITLSVGEDVDAVDGWAQIIFYRTTTSGSQVRVTSIVLNVDDNDTAGLVAPSMIQAKEGEDTTFTLKLASQPYDLSALEPLNTDVTVNLTLGGILGFHVYPSSLTFTSSNWNEPRTVTVRVDEYDQAISWNASVKITASGSDYNGLVKITAVESITNNKVGFILAPSTLSMTEGDSGNFTLRLSSKPFASGPDDVRVNLVSSDSQVSVSPSSLTFTRVNWDNPRTITVDTTVDEDAATPAIKIDLSASGADYGDASDSVKINVVETDTAGVDVYNSSGVRPFGLTTLEGADVDYRMRLISKPRGGNVTLDFSMSSGSDVSLSPTSLTFTPSNWKTLQTVTATTAEDDDEIRNDSTLTIAASGADYGDYSRTIDVYAQDNDIPTYIRLPTGSVTVKEGESVDFTIRLTAKPAENMTVVHNIPQGGSSLYRIEDKSDGITTFYFTPDNWNVPQTVSYFALWKSKGTNDDNVRRLTTRMLTGISGRTESYVYDQVIIAGNGSPMVLSSDALDIGEGSSGTFTLRLREKPVDDSNLTDDKRRIVVALRKSGSGDVTISPTSLTFTPSDWNTAQTVTVSTVADADNADDSASVSFSASGTTFGTANLTDGVRISVKEKALVLSPSTLDIDEGDSERFNVELAAKPSGNVTVSLTSSDSQLSVSPASLTFTPSNWNSAQNVIATAAEDDDRVASTARIDLSASNADYAGITGRVAVSIGDDDAVRFSPVYEIDASGRRKAIDALRMPEFSYRILGMYLEAKPSGNVTVSLATSGHAGLTVEPTSLTFTPSNYYTLQKFRVRSPIFHGATEKSLTLSASGGDYDDVVRKLPVTVDDWHGLGISEGQLTPLEIDEGESATLTVVLRDALNGNERAHVDLAKPGGVDSRVITERILSISPRVLRFDSTNHSRPQTVTLTALEDTDQDNENGSFSFNAYYYDPPPGADLSGNAWRAYQTRSATRTAEVRVKDNTVLQRITPAGLTLSHTSTLRVSEGGSENFTVVLDRQPVGGSVTVSTGVSAGAGASAGASANTGSDLSLSPTRLTFTASNWNAPKTVTVRAAEDDDAANDNASVSLSASGADYGNVTESMQVSILDDDPRGLTLDFLALGLTEGSQKQFTVNLVSQPSGGDVTVAITKSSGSDDVSFSPARLTFTDSNWTTPQNVTVSAAEDADGVDDSATLAVSASGADYAGISDSVSVKITDNDKPGLTIDPSSLDVPEGGSKDFTVKLAGAPNGGDVSVAIVKSGSGDVTISLARLTFKASNWDSAQTVTVNAAEDDDAANDTASLSLTASGANYGGITDSVDIEVSDDEERNLTLSDSSLGLTEGTSKDFTVKLTAAPTGGDVTVTVNKSGSDDVTVSPASLTFKAENWNTPQNVTVNAAEDGDGVADNASVSLTVSGADYAGIADSVVRIEVTDNDTPGLTLPLKLEVAEGGDKRLGISLTAAPTGGNVTVSLTKSGSDDVTISPVSLIFTDRNWESVQSVTVSAAEDEDGADDNASLALTASGADYGDVSAGVQIEVSDDDEKGLSVASTLSLNEGDSKDFTFRLQTKPVGGDVSVAVTKSGSTDVSVSPSSLTFEASNWNTPQTVRVSAAEDEDGANDSARVSLAASGADYGGISEAVSVDVTDNDTPGLTLDPLKLEVDEGGDELLGISLTAAPTGGNVTVSLTKSGSDDVTISPASLTFTADNWESVQSVTVSAAEDEDGADDNASLALTASGADYGDVSASVQIDVSDDDEKGLSVASTLSLNEGGSKDFTFRLQTKPVGGDVTVAVTKSGSTDVSVSPSSLTFEAENWNTPQTVRVNAAEDEDGANDSARVSLAASGADYGGVSEAVSVDVTDNDTPGLTLPLKLEVAEGGDQTLGVSLTAQPSGGNVTVAIAKSGSDDVTISPASLTFTADNWKSVQSVTVSAQEDEDGADDTASLALTASGADYGDVSAGVQIDVSDDDAKGLSVDSTLSLNEGGDKDLTFSLKTKPVGGEVSVAVTKSGSGDVTISKESATFTAENWNDPQTLNVSAAEDADGVNDSARISLSASGADYGGIGESVRVDVSDNDSPGLTLAPTSLSVNEGGDERLGISLTAAPTGGNVIVAIAKSGSDDVTVSPASLTFTADNWKSVQSVTVRAAEDEDGAADSASLSLSASGADYDDVSDVVQVAVKDNDEKGLSVDPTLSLNEGGDKDLTFSLKTKPVGGDVTVAITKSGSTDVSVSPSSLTFTAENWNNPQTLNVSAAEDSDGVDDSARISLSASGADYGGLTADISVEVSDKDTPGLTLAPTTLKVDEGDDTTLEVSLSAQPSGGNVTVAIAKSGSDDVTISPTSLTFTPSNWRSTRSVTVSAAEDDDGADDNANLRLTASGADYAGIVDNVRVEVDDDDPKGLTLAPESLSVTEGSAKNFTVALKTQPASGSVVVSLNASGSSEVSVSPARMTFTASNWNAPKTATVDADEDDDGVKDTATVSLAASGADYGAIADELQVEVNDNDAPGLTFDPSTLDVAEGGEASLEVGLTVQPTGGDVTLALTKSGSEDVSLSPASLTFTPSNWTTPRIVTVVAAEDDDGVKDTAALSVAASGADYDGITGNVQVRVSENETVGLVVEPAILGLTEGGEGAFTAKLSAQPTGGNVALFVTKSGSPDVLLTSTNLIFTADDWSVEQSVTVRANEDHDGIADSAVVSLSASGADYGGVSGGVQVQVSDNDAPGLVLSSLLLAVDEGGSGSVGVKLSVEPSGDVSLALTKNGSADVSFTPSSMTFTPSNWDESQAITVNAAEDSDGHPDTASLSLTATGADYEGITAGVQVQVVENEAFGLSVTPRKLEVREGEEAPFTVSLTAQPNWNVSVALTSENPDVTLSPSTLRFTPSDWNRPKTVVARAAEDDDLLADSTTVTLRASGADFDDITGSMQITVIDDDAEEGINPQVVFDLTLTPESLSLDEGSSARFTVRARAQPVDEEMVVTLVGGGSPDVSFDTDPDTDGLQSALTLTPDNWDVEQPVSVRAAEDDDAAPDRASASFVDAGGKVIILGRVSVAVADDDTPGLSVDPAALQVAENTSGSFTVRPVTRPLGDILVSFDNGETDTALSPPNLKFTSSNWRRARSVTVDGVADVDAEDDAPADITLTARGGGYDGVSARVQVGVDEAAPGTLPEEATPGLVIVGAPVEIDEGGTRDLRVKLRNRPTGDVELALSVSGASIEVDADTWREGNQSALRFSPSNYNGTRVVSLFAPEDEDTNDGRASVSLTASGANYDGLNAKVSVNIDDNDSPALLVSNPAIIDDRRASFTVRLSVEPSAAVGVALSVAGEVEGVAVDTDPDTPGNQTALAFAASDFDVPQRVVVVADEDFEGSSVDIVLAAGGGDYAGIVDRVTVPLGVGEYTDEGDPRYWWPVRTLALAIAPPSVGDRAVVSVGCREESACEVYLDCSAQKNGESFRGGLPESIVGWGVARLSAQDIVDITGGDWSGMGRLGCALHSEERISAQVWTRSGDGVLVNNSALVRSVNIEGVHRADIESIPGPGELDLSNIRIRCRAAYTKHCSMTALSCYDDEGSGYRGDLGTIERGRVRHVQTSELADLIGHRWSGATLGCEFRSDEPFTVQVLTRTGGGALVNNNATGQAPF